MNLNDYNIDAFIKQWRNLILKESMELDESKKKNYIVTLGDEKTGASEAVPIFASTPEDANRKAQEMAKQTGFIVLAVDDANVKINFPQMKADIAYILDYILQYYAPEFKSYKQTLDVLGKDLPKDVVAYQKFFDLILEISDFRGEWKSLYSPADVIGGWGELRPSIEIEEISKNEPR